MLDVHELETDVAIVGGGVAGCLAAIAAAERSARAIVVDKATLTSGGDGATGQKFFQSWIPGEREWDTADEFFRRLWDRSMMLESRKRLRRYTEDVWPMVQRLEKIGMRFRHPVHGQYVRKETMGWGATYSILFDGRDFKKTIARHVTALGVPQLNQSCGVSVLTSDGRASGVVVYDFRKGRLVVIKAAAVVMAAGQACRIYNGVAGSAYNTWHSPYNTGDGQVVAYRAGATVANVEFMTVTLVPKGYAIPGMAALMGLGGYLINASGERFMSRYHPAAERAPRPYLIIGVHNETKEGRGPCFVDCRHLGDDVMRDLLHHLMLERGMWEEYWDQARVDLRTQPMQLEIGELHCEHGILVNEDCETTVPGLYAAGECAGASSISRCCTEGYQAGGSAARYAQYADGRSEVDRSQVEASQERLGRLLSGKPGTDYRELEESVRGIMSSYVGLEKCESGLLTALRQLEALQDRANALVARNHHEALRCLEAQNLLDFALLTTDASLRRQESRMGVGGGAGELFLRSDYPEMNSPEWEKLVTVRQEDGRRAVRLAPVPD